MTISSRVFAPLLLLVSAITLGSGCSYSSTIVTTPGEVDVSIGESYLGKTQEGDDGRAVVAFQRPWGPGEGSYGVPTEYTVTLARAGYKTRTVTIKSGYRADASLAWLLAGIIPYFFTARLDETYSFDLEPEISSGIQPK